MTVAVGNQRRSSLKQLLTLARQQLSLLPNVTLANAEAMAGAGYRAIGVAAEGVIGDLASR